MKKDKSRKSSKTEPGEPVETSSRFPTTIYVMVGMSDVEGRESEEELKLITDLSKIPEGTEVAEYSFEQSGIAKHKVTLE